MANRYILRTRVVAIGKSLLLIAIFLLLLFVVSSLTNGITQQYGRLLYGIEGITAAIIAIFILVKIDRLSFRDIQLFIDRHTLSRFLLGVFISICIMAIILLAFHLFTRLEIHIRRDFRAPSLVLLLSIFLLAFMEELAFRTYSFINLHKHLGLRPAQLIIALAFAVYHLLNGWDFSISFLGPGIWSFIFCIAAAWSKGIAVPTGIHTGINLLQLIAGLKGDTASLLELRYATPPSTADLNRTDNVGIGIQISLLVVALVATEWFIRKQRPVSSD